MNRNHKRSILKAAISDFTQATRHHPIVYTHAPAPPLTTQPFTLESVRKILQSDNYEELQRLIDDKYVTNMNAIFQKAPNHSLLMVACIAGSLECVKILLANKANINLKVKYYEPNSILRCSSTSGNLQLVEYVIAHGAEVNDVVIYTCLRSLLTITNIDIVKLLVHHLTVIVSLTNRHDNRGLISLIELACKLGRLDVVEFVLEHTKDRPVIQAYVHSAFLIAAKCGHIHILSFLLSRPEITPQTLSSAITYACPKNRVKVIRYLLQNGGIIDNRPCEKPILGTALIKRYYKLATVLIKHNVDVNAITIDQRSMLYLACLQNNLHIVKLLIAKDVDIDDLDPDYPLLRVSYRNNKIIKLLLAHGVDPNIHYDDGKTPLLDVAESGYIRHHENNGGMYGCSNGPGCQRCGNGDYSDNEYGASDVDDDDDSSSGDETEGGVSDGGEGGSGDGSVDESEDESGSDDGDDVNKGEALMRLLLQYNADVNLADAITGETPLMLAALDLNVGKVKLLLEYGADVSKVDDRGRNVLVKLGQQYTKSTKRVGYSTRSERIVQLCQQYMDINSPDAKPLLK